MTTRWLRISDACTYAGVCRNTLKAMIKRGDIVGARTPGGHWRVDRESIDAHFGPSREKALAILRSLAR